MTCAVYILLNGSDINNIELNLVSSASTHRVKLFYVIDNYNICLLYTSPSPRDRQKSRMPSSA